LQNNACINPAIYRLLQGASSRPALNWGDPHTLLQFHIPTEATPCIDTRNPGNQAHETQLIAPDPEILVQMS
jgi:hypothetical protein